MKGLSTIHEHKAATPVPMRAPSGLLQRKCACGQHTIAGGECAECSKKKRFGLQTKLKVNEPGDIYEQEADRIADQVMAAPAHHAVSGAPPPIQRFSGQPTGQTDAAPASVDQALASPGRPLEPALRRDMEQRFGHDFSRVRVHTGAVAKQSAQNVNAHAYTLGQDIVFGAGGFAPETHAGRRLLAHELAHVLQQGPDRNPVVQQHVTGQRQVLQRKNGEEAGGAFKQRTIFFSDFETLEKRPFKKDTNWGTTWWPAEDDSTFELFFVGSYLGLPKMSRGVGELEGHMSMKDFRDMKLENETYYPRLDFKLLWNQIAPEAPLNLASPVPADYDPNGGGTTKVLVTYVYGGFKEHKDQGKMGDHTLVLTFVYSSDTSETSEASAEVGGSYKGIEAKAGFSESVTVTRAAISWTWQMRFRTYSYPFLD